jgi:hypothetical protein
MQWFVDHYDKGIPSTNSVDEGYRCIMAAWRAGKQLFLQPLFARSDQKFNTREVNRSSTVASDRSGNERAINVAKRAGVLKRGLRLNESPDVNADVWIAWGFQANFMYKPVLELELFYSSCCYRLWIGTPVAWLPRVKNTALYLSTVVFWGSVKSPHILNFVPPCRIPFNVKKTGKQLSGTFWTTAIIQEVLYIIMINPTNC